MSLFLSSGEASGDHYTANLAKTLRASGCTDELWGMGGIESRNAGIRVEWPGERLQLLGFTEVISSIPSIFALRDEMVESILEKKPKSVIVADSPDFHMRLIAKLRKRGYKGSVFYISPPAVWAWRSSRVYDIKALVDFCLPLFRFEHEYLVERGCRSCWRGHPLVEEFSAATRFGNFTDKVTGDKGLVAFLPGSRKSEIKTLLPVMERTADELVKRGWHTVFSVAPGLNQRIREMMIDRLKNNGFEYYEGPGRDLMAVAKCAIGASGTITVESLLLNCYMIVAYRLNPISAMVGRLVLNTKYFAMANILAGCEMFPELIQENATAENMLARSLAWLESDAELRALTDARMDAARKTMGEPGVYKFWAEKIMEAAACVSL